jgi:hypothetical protein
MASRIGGDSRLTRQLTSFSQESATSIGTSLSKFARRPIDPANSQEIRKTRKSPAVTAGLLILENGVGVSAYSAKADTGFAIRIRARY